MPAPPRAGDLIVLEGTGGSPRLWLLLEEPDDSRKRPLCLRGSVAEVRLHRAIYGDRRGKAPVYAVPVDDQLLSRFDVEIEHGGSRLVLHDCQSILVPCWVVHGMARIVGRISSARLADVLNRPHAPTTTSLIWAESIEHREWIKKFSRELERIAPMMDAQ